MSFQDIEMLESARHLTDHVITLLERGQILTEEIRATVRKHASPHDLLDICSMLKKAGLLSQKNLVVTCSVSVFPLLDLALDFLQTLNHIWDKIREALWDEFKEAYSGNQNNARFTSMIEYGGAECCTGFI